MGKQIMAGVQGRVSTLSRGKLYSIHEFKVKVYPDPFQITHSVLPKMHLKAMPSPLKGWKQVSYTLKYSTFQL